MSGYTNLEYVDGNINNFFTFFYIFKKTGVRIIFFIFVQVNLSTQCTRRGNKRNIRAC